MIVYFDTSAVIPLMVEQPGSTRAAQLWDLADHVVAVRLLHVEARAALAQAHRLGRLSAHQFHRVDEQLDDLWAQFDVLEIGEELVRRAGDLAVAHGLRGYDAVHLAGAERVADADTVLASGDEALCAAAQSMGIAISPTSGT